MLDVRRQALGLLEAGHSCRHVSRVLGVGVNPVRRWAMLAGMELMRGRHGRARAVPHAEPVDPAGPLTTSGRLNLAGRTVIWCRRRDGWSMRRIAAQIGVAPLPRSAGNCTAAGASVGMTRTGPRPRPTGYDADPNRVVWTSPGCAPRSWPG